MLIWNSLIVNIQNKFNKNVYDEFTEQKWQIALQESEERWGKESKFLHTQTWMRQKLKNENVMI